MTHHKYEDHAIMLGDLRIAMKNPYEWQLAENIVYCDYLEHLFCHILICDSPSDNRNPIEAVGIGGVVNFLVPELNDVYSGWITGQDWRAICYKKIINDVDVYLELLRRFKHNCSDNPIYSKKCLLTSLNEKFGLCSKDKNKKIFKTIESL